MPAPEEVNNRRFPVSRSDVLYNDGDCSIAYSTWDGGSPSVGIRWNYQQGGMSENGKGYPNYGKYPTWFILSPPTAIAMLLGLLQTDFPDKSERRLREVIKELGGSASE